MKKKYHGKLASALASLNQLLAEHLRYSANQKKVVSNATKNDRHKIMTKMIKDLHQRGYKITDINNLGGRHVNVLADVWENDRQLSSSSLQKHFSTLKLLCRWINKPDLVGDPVKWLKDPARYQRTYIAEEDKSWRSNGVDQQQVLTLIESQDECVALQLKLAAAFGLRVQETALLRPHKAIVGDHLNVRWGTKGGRPQLVPIETDEQWNLLEQAKTYAPYPDSSTIPINKTLKQWINHFYYIIRQYGGIKRINGITAHGLRHEYANDRFEKLTGETTAVRGGTGEHISAELEHQSRQQVSNELGHNRVQITYAYTGGGFTSDKEGTR